MADKLPWTFDRNIPNSELRVARALEYIAHYLERIDGHLERIAEATGDDAKSKALLVAINGVTHALNRGGKT